MPRKQLQNQGSEKMLSMGIKLRNKIRTSADNVEVRELMDKTDEKSVLDTPKDYSNVNETKDTVCFEGNGKIKSISDIIKPFSKDNGIVNSEKPRNLESINESKAMHKNKKAIQQEVMKFRKKFGRIHDELAKIKKKKLVFIEKEKLLKSKKIKLISKLTQRDIPLELFKELRESQPEVEVYPSENDFMEERAVENLVELIRRTK